FGEDAGRLVQLVQRYQAQALLDPCFLPDLLAGRQSRLLDVEGEGLGEPAAQVQVVAALQGARLRRQRLPPASERLQRRSGPEKATDADPARWEQVAEYQRRQVVRLEGQRIAVASGLQSQPAWGQTRGGELSFAQDHAVAVAQEQHAKWEVFLARLA